MYWTSTLGTETTDYEDALFPWYINKKGHHGEPYKEREYGIRYDVTRELLFKNNCKCNVTFINIKLTT